MYLVVFPVHFRAPFKMKELSKLLHFVEIWQRKWCSSSFCYCHTTTFVVSYSCYATTATSIAFFKCTWMCDVLKRAKIPRLVSVLYTVMKIWFFVGKFWLYLNTASKENEKKCIWIFTPKIPKNQKLFTEYIRVNIAHTVSKVIFFVQKLNFDENSQMI